ncbi:hypothetical protein DAEQUDRAFT_112173 [Daedalea quercina L-15889]|uniref:Uncharacterized protein n=1 Tax=Daedalea quercina L-15889 TaxID=1314783 RepID=A0A165S5L1_9APHY|nr:hypothetical protein DAEQUDRAFT_112173 [Daedalea quercina L-15889]
MTLRSYGSRARRPPRGPVHSAGQVAQCGPYQYNERGAHPKLFLGPPSLSRRRSHERRSRCGPCASRKASYPVACGGEEGRATDAATKAKVVTHLPVRSSELDTSRSRRAAAVRHLNAGRHWAAFGARGGNVDGEHRGRPRSGPCPCTQQ